MAKSVCAEISKASNDSSDMKALSYPYESTNFSQKQNNKAISDMEALFYPHS